MVSYEVLDTWRKRRYDHTYYVRERNVRYEVTVYKIIEYESRRYYDPRNGNTFLRTVETDSWYEEVRRPTND